MVSVVAAVVKDDGGIDEQWVSAVGMVPIIRCPRGNAAEMVSEKLDKKLRENLRDARSSLFMGDSVSSGQVRLVTHLR